MNRYKKQFRYALLYLLTLIILFFSLSGGGASREVYAASSDTQAAYESTNVLDDLTGAVIGDNDFNLSDYPFDENGQPQMISFIEFCYSFYSNKQDDYALYVYVYNPQGLAFDTSTSRNKIQLTYGSKSSYDKYKLIFLNYSTKAGYEGLFYKFKISLSDSDTSEILNNVVQDSRVYKISGIELSVSGTVTEYTVAQTYTYSGYALGYGSVLATEGTLSCTVDGLNLYLSLDVYSTYYRPDGTNGTDNTQDTLHSVYFAVPNDIIDEYGEMTAVHATWLNAVTNYGLCTGNNTAYTALLDLVGVELETFSYQNTTYTADTSVPYGYVSEYSYGLGSSYGYTQEGDISFNYFYGGGINSIKNQLSRLSYLFYADDGDADNYTISSEKMLEWFSKYTALFGGELVNDSYSVSLFESYDNEFTDINITADTEYYLTNKQYTLSWYNKIFGGSTLVSEDFDTAKAIEKITLSDMDNSIATTTFCNNYYVAESDYDELYDYVKLAESNDKTVYLFRYYQSEYFSQEASLCKHYSIKATDTNAYFFKTAVQLGFDIIDLTFTKNGVSTVIPVVMSPMDIVADVTPPINTTTDNANAGFWKYGAGIIGGLIAVYVIYKIVAKVGDVD